MKNVLTYIMLHIPWFLCHPVQTHVVWSSATGAFLLLLEVRQLIYFVQKIFFYLAFSQSSSSVTYILLVFVRSFATSLVRLFYLTTSSQCLYRLSRTFDDEIDASIIKIVRWPQFDVIKPMSATSLQFISYVTNGMYSLRTMILLRIQSRRVNS